MPEKVSLVQANRDPGRDLGKVYRTKCRLPGLGQGFTILYGAPE
jgi:hypothetical protein